MARNTNIKLRRSASAGAIPTTSNLDLGELALNTIDGKLYMKTTEGSLDSVVQIGSATDSYFKIRKSATLTFAVTVAAKTTDHIYHGSGSSSGYQINGIESPHLNLVQGNTYKFDQSESSNSGHPLRFYYDAAKTTVYTSGVTTAGTLGSSGAYTQIVPTKDTPMVLYYQCSSHGYMGGAASFSTRNLTGFDTDELGEGSSNLYFTNARARAAVSAGTGISYNSSTGVITNTITQYANSDVDSHLNQSNPTSGYVLSWNGSDYAWVDNAGFTTANARAAISVTDSGGDGSLAYNNSTGVITYTGPSLSEVQTHIDNSASNVRAHLSAGTGVTYSGGQISIGQAVATNSNVQFNNLQVDGTLTSDDITSTNIAATGNLTVSGNLTVQGTTTTVNSTTLDVVDKNLTLNYHASNDTSGNANGAGITIQDAVNASTDATLLWVAATDKFAFSHGITTPTITASGTNILSGLTYPTSDGSSGQALVTDGSGNLSFGSISAGGNAFGRITVSGQSNVDADSNSDTLTLVAGSNISITTSAGADSVTINSTASGSALTIQEEGSSLSTAGSTLNFVGAGVTASGTGATKTITIPGTGTVSEAFKTIAVSGQSSIVADSATDTLTLAAGSNMTITQDASTDTITFASSGSGGGGQSALYKEYVYTPGSTTTTFTGSDANGATLSYTVGYLSVYLNGVLLKPTTDYTASSGSSVVLVNAAASGDVIQIATFVQIVGTGDSTVTAVTYSGSGTITLGANPNHENNTQLYIDGVYQNKDTYSISGTTLTFGTTPPAGALVEIVIGSRNVTVDDVEGLTVNGTLDVTGATTLAAATLSGALVGTTGDLSGDLTVAGNISLDGSNKELRFYEGSNYVGFEAPALSADKIWVLPAADGTAGFALKTDGSGNLSWGLAGGNAFETISVSGQSNVVADSSSDTLTLVAGTGLSITTAAGSDAITFTNTSVGANAFGNIVVSGQTTLAADSTNDNLTIVGAGGITATTTVGTDTLTLTGQTSINPYTQDFFTASGTGSALVTYTLSVTPPSEDNLIVFVEGVYQNKNSYALSGTTLTLDAGVIAGHEVVVHIIQNGVVGAGHIVDEFTGNGSTAAYTLSVTPLNENNTFVYLDGVYQEKSTYSVSGNTLTFPSNITSGHSIEVVTPQVAQVNQPAAASINNANMFDSSAVIPQAVTSTTLTTTSASTIATHAAATYRTVKYLVQLTQGTDYHSTEINVIHDGTTVYITEYGTLYDNAVLGTFDAAISGGNILLKVTPGSNASLTAKVVSTAIPL